MYFRLSGWEFWVETVENPKGFSEMYSCEDARIMRIWRLRIVWNLVEKKR